MYTYALIDESGFILQTISCDEALEDAPNLVSAKVSEGLIRPRWTGKRWSEGASDGERDGALAQARAAGLVELARVAEDTRARVSPAGPHALAVRGQKLREARSLLQGCCSEEPFILELEGKALGLDVKTAAVRVLDEHKSWCLAMGHIEGELARYSEMVRKQESRSKLETVVSDGVAAIRAVGWALLNPGVSAGDDAPPEEPDAASDGSGAEELAIAIKDPKPAAEVAVKEVVEAVASVSTLSRLAVSKADEGS